MKVAWPRISDPGLSSLKFAIRAAVLMPAVFAVATQVLQDPQLAVFAAFGSFALLAFVDFRGTARSRLTAYRLAGRGRRRAGRARHAVLAQRLAGGRLDGRRRLHHLVQRGD